MTDPEQRPDTERILAEVKRRRAEGEAAAATETEKTDLIIFGLHDDYYALYGSEVTEILPYEPITFVPGCPDAIIGIINVRGDIESVLDLHRVLGLDPGEPTRKSRIIIAVGNGIRSGILVDRVEDVISVPVADIKRPISTLDRTIRRYAVGGETLYGNQYVTILDAGKLFAGFGGQ